MTQTDVTAAPILDYFRNSPADSKNRTRVVSVTGRLTTAVEHELTQGGLKVVQQGNETRIYRAADTGSERSSREGEAR